MKKVLRLCIAFTLIVSTISANAQGMRYLDDVFTNVTVTSDVQYAENISIDYAIIENSEEVMVIPASFSWNDLGTWCSLEDELPGDAESNTVVNSRFIPVEATGNIVRTESNKVVLVDGLKDYMILENDEVLLIVPKEKEQEIKHIRNEVIERYGLQFA